MKYIFSFFSIFLLTSCSFPWSKDEINEAAKDMKGKAEKTIGKSKETAGKIKENALNVKRDIEEKVNDVDRAITEINQAKQAIDHIFNSSSPKNIFLCETDDQCIVAHYQGCCAEKTSIHKDFLDEYKKNPHWQKDSIDCSSADCQDISHFTVPKCLPDSSGMRRCVLSGDK